MTPQQIDEAAARELELWADNTFKLHNQKQSIIANIKRRLKNNTYDHSKAPRLWQFWVDAAAKDYVREFGSPGDRIDTVFNAATRRQVAKEFADSEIRRIRAGEYDPSPILGIQMPHPVKRFLAKP